MLLITNLQLERKIDSKGHQKVYILNLHTSDSEFTNDMNFFGLFFYISFFVLVRLSVSNLVLLFNLVLDI